MISVNNLSASYGKGHVIKDINMHINKGEIVSIIGPNGCGKSTLLKCLGKQLPYSGSIRLFDVPISQIPGKEYAKKVSYLKQSRDTPAITAESLVLHGRFPYMGFPRKLTDKDVDIAKAAMEKTGVLELRHKMLYELSGGECQKVYLAMALAQDSDILLLDEPTTYLDICYQLEFYALLKQLRLEGKTIVAILHDINSALQISDTVCLMNDGEITFYGVGQKLLQTNRLESVFGVKVSSVVIDDSIHIVFNDKGHRER